MMVRMLLLVGLCASALAEEPGNNPLPPLLPPPAPEPPEPSPPQTLAAWLAELGRSQYEATFLSNFNSLAEVVVTAVEDGIPAILDECGVKGMGAKTAMRKAIESLVAN